ncbi:TetR/AcrR family transcriptional regulator [Aquiflexum sp.]|uniref:TetR/AcrR family transcriptional regulator n=1 Tax=Aquiflexum sp. TaxID=1872584 RepID=UPI0035939678
MPIFVSIFYKMSKKSEIEAKILQVAYNFFIEKGYRNTTMDEIAQKLGISKKTLYKYFPGKLELLGAAFDMLTNKLSIKVNAILDNDMIPYTVKLKSILTDVAKDIAPINPKILEELREFAPEIWKELLDYIRESGYLRFQKLMQEGIKKGYVLPHTNVAFVVFVYTSAIQNLIDNKFLSQFPDEMRASFDLSPAQIYDQAIQIIYSGILTEEAQKELRQI